MAKFFRQFVAVLGVALGMAGYGIVMDYSSESLNKLRNVADFTTFFGSEDVLIAVAPHFTLLFQPLIAPTIMRKWGRKPANIISVILMLLGSICFLIAKLPTMTLIARIIQGIGVGLLGCLSSITIGEYSSPKHREKLLLLSYFFLSSGEIISRLYSIYFIKDYTAAVCLTIACINLLVAIFSPETPTWLANREKYDKCKEVFKEIRYTDEEEELNEMTEPCIREYESDEAYQVSLKGEFIKPLILVTHVYMLSQWGGQIMMKIYPEMILNTINLERDKKTMQDVLILLYLQQLIYSFMYLILTKLMKRRTVFLITAGLNIVILLIFASYTSGYIVNQLYIEVILISFLAMSVRGSLICAVIISGEVFVSKYKEFSSALSVFVIAISFFVCLKLMPFMFEHIGSNYAYLISAAIVAYCAIVSLCILPETKRKTLLEIEDEFKGYIYNRDNMRLQSVQTTTVNCRRRVRKI